MALKPAESRNVVENPSRSTRIPPIAAPESEPVKKLARNIAWPWVPSIGRDEHGDVGLGGHVDDPVADRGDRPPQQQIGQARGIGGQDEVLIVVMAAPTLKARR